MSFVLVYCCLGMLMTSCFWGAKPILGRKRITLPESLGLAYVLHVETNPFPNLSLFNRTMLFEYPSVLSRFCLTFIKIVSISYFPKRPSGAPLHTLSKLYDVSLGFVPLPSFEAVYFFICGRQRVIVARYLMNWNKNHSVRLLWKVYTNIYHKWQMECQCIFFRSKQKYIVQVLYVGFSQTLVSFE